MRIHPMVHGAGGEEVQENGSDDSQGTPRGHSDRRRRGPDSGGSDTEHGQKEGGKDGERREEGLISDVRSMGGRQSSHHMRHRVVRNLVHRANEREIHHERRGRTSDAVGDRH